jgi:predicted 3-demethylubiquinone-9 3-methyltransferase (glyoxalase superfamily)
MAKSFATQLMFEGDAEQAMTFYLSLFSDSALVSIERYGPGQPGQEGSVKRAEFRLGTHALACIDSPAKHAFTFTPSVSLFIECESTDELDRLFSALAAGGTELMPLANYGFSKRFGWVADRFGVSWQLNLA